MGSNPGILLVTLMAVGLWILPAAAQEDGWRKVLAFDVVGKEQSHKADLGKGRRVVATGEAGHGWEIEVLAYGDKTGTNLLYDGHNWHGIQPWMVFAGTRHEQIYPDTREIAYDGGKAKLRIVLVDCRTRTTGKDSSKFVQGRIEVFHKP